MDKHKLRNSGKTSVLEDGSSELIGKLSKEDNDIFDSKTSECESKSENWEKYLTL